MRTTEFTRQKEDAILQAYERAIRHFGNNARFLAWTALIRQAMTYPAPRYYFQYEQADKIISSFERNIMPWQADSEHYKLYNEFYEKYKCYPAGIELGNRRKIIERLLDSPASGFGISERRFVDILRKALKNTGKNTGRRRMDIENAA